MLLDVRMTFYKIMFYRCSLFIDVSLWLSLFHSAGGTCYLRCYAMQTAKAEALLIFELTVYTVLFKKTGPWYIV